LQLLARYAQDRNVLQQALWLQDPAFVARAANNGLKFGAVHEANGYQFANAKDPDGNSVSVWSRAFRRG
jgi:hypothetical protein